MTTDRRIHAMMMNSGCGLGMMSDRYHRAMMMNSGCGLGMMTDRRIHAMMMNSGCSLGMMSDRCHHAMTKMRLGLGVNMNIDLHRLRSTSAETYPDNRHDQTVVAMHHRSARHRSAIGVIRCLAFHSFSVVSAANTLPAPSAI